MKSKPQTGTSIYQEEKKENEIHSPKLQNECLLYFTFTITFHKLPTVRVNYNVK